MGKINEVPNTDMLQLLNAGLQERRGILEKELGENGFYIYSPSTNNYEVRSEVGNIAVFSLQALPGCCGAVVSYHSEVAERVRHKGLGRHLLHIRMDACRRRGYGQMIATVLANNLQEIGLLKDSGWVRASIFRNPNTNNLVTTWLINL